jgi:class 3 adenylate cyclase
MDSIKRWLATLGLAQYVAEFERNDIDPGLLSKLTDQDLRELGIHSLGHRKKLLEAIAELKSGDAPTSASVAPENQTLSQSTSATEGERRQLTVLFCDMVGSTAPFSRAPIL